MQFLRSKPVLIGLIALVVIALGLALSYYFIVYKAEPEVIVFNSYDCEDGSFYTVLNLDNSIGVAGKVYDLVSSEDGMRYEGPWPLAFTVRDSLLEVSLKESGESITTCTQGEFKGLPTTGV